MKTFQPILLFVGFDDEEAGLIADHFRSGQNRPAWDVMDVEDDVVAAYRITRPDLVLVCFRKDEITRISAILSSLIVERKQLGSGTSLIVMGENMGEMSTCPFLEEGADSLISAGQLASLAEEQVRRVQAEAEAAGDGTSLLEQQVQSQRLETIGTLAGGIAHDFNNILAAIMGFAHSALLDVEEESGTARDLNSIIGAAERAASLTTQIMAFSRRRKLNSEPVDFAEVVSGGLEMSRAAIPSNVRFDVQLDEEAGDVKADATQWQQVVLNLCLNAAQAMEDQQGGTITVRLRQVSVGSVAVHRAADIKPGDYIELTVADDGTGMPDSVRRRIFEPFFTSRKPGKGTGLGMAVVHGIVSGDQGTISVESRMGEGSKITILVPCIRSGESKANSSNQGKNLAGKSLITGHEKILFVDDEPDIGRAFAQPLRRLGYEITVCQSGVEAFRLFNADPSRFDLIITDQIMPELSGSELARKVAAHGNNTPVVICSGYHTEKISELRSVPNVSEVLRKPVSPHRMGEAIRAAIDN